MYRIFIIEDDLKIASILHDYLVRYGYEVVQAQDYRQIKQECVKMQPDLVLLDINLPYYDGFYWCRQIRTASNVPIIFISARTGEMDQVMAIENGGDDYITKPFHLEIVISKVKSLLRRTYGEYAGGNFATRNIYHVGGLYLYGDQNVVEWKGKRIELSKKEFRLLNCLVQKANQIVSREELLEVLWDDIEFVDDNTLSVNVTRVRRRLGELGIRNAIETKRSQGYRLVPNWESGQ
ncbi:response regulator transcription factor [Aneurinibacillus aneurinilyticus]|uniref:response regulator transcription factor n=1 Tax=Aneurinibacillus aneurinilyticus TaxID=1391 RepID=UPI0023F39B34|nr:response regulator transcription factor [Aneurinibacillus aneurinilyticus]